MLLRCSTHKCSLRQRHRLPDGSNDKFRTEGLHTASEQATIRLANVTLQILRLTASESFVFWSPGLGNQTYQRLGNVCQVADEDYWALPAKSCATSGCVNEHQSGVEGEDESHAVFCEGQVGTAIQNIGCEGTDDEFDTHKRHLTVAQNASHQAIAFSGHIQMHPNQSQLSIEQVHRE